MPDKYDPNEIVQEYIEEDKEEDEEDGKQKEKESIAYKLHPWHGKSKRDRKQYIEELLIAYKTGKMQKDAVENKRLKEHVGMTKNKKGMGSPPKH